MASKGGRDAWRQRSKGGAGSISRGRAYSSGATFDVVADASVGNSHAEIALRMDASSHSRAAKTGVHGPCQSVTLPLFFVFGRLHVIAALRAREVM